MLCAAAQGADRVVLPADTEGGQGKNPSTSLGASPSVYVSRGVSWAERGEWDKAVEDLKRAYALDPANVETLIDLCLAYTEKKDFENAANYGRRAVEAVKAGPSDRQAGAYHALGLALEGLGEDQKAEAAYREGIARDPSDAGLYLTLGNLYGKAKSLDRALTAYEEVVRLDPKNEFVYSNIAYVHEAMGNAAEAMKALDRATEANPRDEVAWYDLGAAHGKRREWDKAIECYKKSLKIDAKFYKACISAALAYEKKGDLTAASEYYVRALSLTDDPRLKEAILRLITESSEELPATQKLL